MLAVNAMVVDDSGIMRKLVMAALRDSKLAEFTFTEAVDGADALSKFDPETIQCLFVDWNMPNMNGIDFVRKARQVQKRHVPIVMVTTESTMGKVEEALDQAGADCFIVKPFTVEGLQSKLQSLIEKLEQGEQKPAGFFGRLAAKLG